MLVAALLFLYLAGAWSRYDALSNSNHLGSILGSSFDHLNTFDYLTIVVWPITAGILFVCTMIEKLAPHGKLR